MNVVEQRAQPFSQLYCAEEQTLRERASRVPDNGLIVDVGTAQGGSATIFQSVAGVRGVKIYSYDVAPSKEAHERLKDTNVTIVAKSSVEGAAAWPEKVGRPIDLLFVDGSHALQHVFEDYNAWVRFLKPGGEFIFHDLDSDERGGLVHLGTEIALRTLLRKNQLGEPVHTDRILYGNIARPDQARLAVEDCFETFVALGQKITRIYESNYSGWSLVGESEMGNLLKICLNIDPSARFFTPEQVSAERPCFVFSRPLNTAIQIIEERGIATERVVPLSSLQVCYIMGQALQSRRDELLARTLSRKEFFRWEEIMFMHEHALGPSPFPRGPFEKAASNNVFVLSALVAREQVWLSFAARMLGTFFAAWRP